MNNELKLSSDFDEPLSFDFLDTFEPFTQEQIDLAIYVSKIVSDALQEKSDSAVKLCRKTFNKNPSISIEEKEIHLKTLLNAGLITKFQFYKSMLLHPLLDGNLKLAKSWLQKLETSPDDLPVFVINYLIKVRKEDAQAKMMFSFLIQNLPDICKYIDSFTAQDVQLLLELGPTLISPKLLIEAFRLKNEKWIRELFTRGASMDALFVSNTFEPIRCFSQYFPKGSNLLRCLKQLGADFSKSKLLLWAQGNNPFVFMELLELGANVNVKDSKGFSPLYYAFIDMNKQRLTQLLDKGAKDVNIRHPDTKKTMVHWAFDTMEEDLFNKILKLGADINAISIDNVPPLHYAACYDNKKQIDLLLLFGADINARDPEGNTALNYVCIKKNYLMACYLLDKGADFLARNEKGLSPISNARQTTFAEYILVKHNCDYSNAIEKALLLDDMSASAQFITMSDPKTVEKAFIDVHLKHPHIALQYFLNHLVMINLSKLQEESVSMQIGPAPDVDYLILLKMFENINFSYPTLPGYRNPDAIYDDDRVLVTPQNLYLKLTELLQSLSGRPFYRLELKSEVDNNAYYDKLTQLIKHITFEIQKMDDPDKQTSALIDLAISGMHCYGRPVGDFEDMYYRIKNKGVNPTFEQEYLAKLRDMRRGIIYYLSGNKGKAHANGEYMALIGTKVGAMAKDSLPQIADMTSLNDVSEEEAASQFLQAYYPGRVFCFTENFIKDVIKTQRGDWFYYYLREMIPPNWEDFWQPEEFNLIKTVKEEIKTQPIEEVLKKFSIHHVPGQDALLSHCKWEADNYITTSVLDEDFAYRPTAALPLLMQTGFISGLLPIDAFLRIMTAFNRKQIKESNPMKKQKINV